MNDDSESSAAYSGTISGKALERDFGTGIARSFVSALSQSPDRSVPDYERLLVGDVILVKTPPGPIEGGLFGSSVVEFQQKRVDRFRESPAATWAHAMLYVGRLHVAECKTLFLDNGRIKSGIKISPLVRTSRNTEYVVCRHKGWKTIEGFDGYRRNAALYAMVDHAVSRRVYDFKRIAALYFDGKVPLLPSAVVRRMFKSNFDRAVICSEFVLECLAIGGQMLTEDWLRLEERAGRQQYFYPADFYTHPSLEQHPMQFLAYEPS